MHIVITCGPSFEPIDRVRRITNFSTGELGTILAREFTGAGFRVTCLRGAGSTFPWDAPGAGLIPFETNDDLARELERVAKEDAPQAVFHAAALCDYRLEKAEDRRGHLLAAKKIPTRDGPLILTLGPAAKILPLLRPWFPESRIVGWKYELDGGAEDALAKGRRQIGENRTDACVVNGAAFGAGFGFLTKDSLVPLPDKQALAGFLAEWLKNS